jgi:hypothetical protein
MDSHNQVNTHVSHPAKFKTLQHTSNTISSKNEDELMRRINMLTTVVTDLHKSTMELHEKVSTLCDMLEVQ